MQVFCAPDDFHSLQPTYEKSIFLAGSIEMGKAIPWQDALISRLDPNSEVTIYNPRRPDWDSSWVQEKTNIKFREQVEWEHKRILHSDLVIFVFDPNTKSPITLQEHGMVSGRIMGGSNQTMYIYCPAGFWRKGNVDILNETVKEWRYTISRVKEFSSMEELINATRLFISN